MEKKELTPAEAKMAFKFKLLNICMFALAVVLTITALITFFVSLFNATGGAYYIASTYILCMLLATPSLKAFLDKVNSPAMKKLNTIGIISIFAAIMTIFICVCLDFAIPTLF